MILKSGQEEDDAVKICYLADATNYHTKKWCNYFSKQGFEIHVISLQTGTIPGVKVHAFNETDLNERSSVSKLNYLGYRSKVKKLVHQIRPDILHAHYATSYGMLGAGADYHPFVISVWGSDVYEFPRASPLHAWLLKQNLKPADMIMSTSKDMARETATYTDKEIKITPFGVDVEVFKPLEGIEKKADFVIGTAKALMDIYGINYLIDAFAIFKQRHPEASLALEIAGTGPREEDLKAQVEALGLGETVHFLGFLPMDQVVEAYNRMDVAVMPSLIESFGVSAVEAQACGTPVIATNVGGLPEATWPGHTSLLVEKENALDLADAIESLFLDREKLKDMSQASRPFVLENYNIEDNFSYVRDLYEALLASREWG